MGLMRHAFLELSRNDAFRQILMGFKPTQRVARRFVAGRTWKDALAAVQELNSQGLLVTLDHLGENVTSRGEAERAAEDYCAILEQIAANDLRSTISIKLTHLGLDAGEDVCLQNAMRIVETAGERDILVEIDMEGSDYTASTLDIYATLRDRYEKIRVCVQTYLYRTQADVEWLIERGGSVRLCKGAYKEPAKIAYQRKKDIDANFVRLLELMFDDRARERGAYPAVATHDGAIIDWARVFAVQHQTPFDAFEFQMLYGVRRPLQRQLADQGYRVRIYVPFGSQWYPYFMRRLAERPANVAFFLRSLMGE